MSSDRRGVMCATLAAGVAGTVCVLAMLAMAAGPDTQPSATGPASTQAGSGPAGSGPASTQASQSSRVTTQQFQQVMRQDCARCHPQFASVDNLRSGRWVVPGKPDSSRLYKVLRASKPPARPGKHTVSEADKQLIRDFIEQMTPSPSPAASGPVR